MGEALSARKFAELVGRSNVYISRKVKEGALPVDENGRIPKEEGLAAFNSLGVLGYEANRENAEKVRAASKKKPVASVAPPVVEPKTRGKKQAQTHTVVAPGPAPEPKGAPAQQRIELPEDDEAALLLLHQGKLSAGQTTALYNRWKAKEKHLQNMQREAEFRKRQGDLLETSAVRADAAALAIELTEQLRSLAPRISGLCEMRTAREIEVIIDSEVNEAIGVFRKSRFVDATVLEG